MTSTPAREVKLLGAVTVAGQLAWLLQDSHEVLIYVAAHGEPYILRAVGSPPGEDSVNLTQWNAVRIPGPHPRARSCTPASSQDGRSPPARIAFAGQMPEPAARCFVIRLTQRPNKPPVTLRMALDHLASRPHGRTDVATYS